MPPDTLLAIYRTQPTARKLFDWLRRVGSKRNYTTVDDLIEHLSVTRRIAIPLLRSLADAGCGEFKVGRKGHPSRLEWAKSPRGLAEALAITANGHNPDLPVSPPVPTPVPEEPTAEESSNGTDLITHNYVLRPGLRIDLHLPVNLSTSEAKVLSAWIKNLSFER
jgi:hypothetical protein